MKGAYVLAGIATLATAAAEKSSCDPASVYLYKGHKEQHTSFEDSSAPELNLDQNQLVLADVAGTSRFHKYKSESDARLVNALVGKKSIFNRGSSSNIVVVVDGVDTNKGELMSVEPSYRLESSPDMDYFKGLFDQFSQHLKEISGKLRTAIVEGMDVVTSKTSLHQRRSLINMEDSFTSGSEGEADELFDSVVNHDLVKIESLTSALYKGDSAFVRLDSLREAPSSKQYDEALVALRQSLQELTAGPFRVAIVAIPRDACSISGFVKRDESAGSSESTVSTGPHLNIFQHSSKEKCESETNNCSGHGSCAKVGGNNYACVCKPSYDKERKKTTYWAGNSCQKKDVSVEFQMFFWTGLGILLAVASGIKLMMSIGNDPLPGVLSASTVSSKKQ